MPTKTVFETRNDIPAANRVKLVELLNARLAKHVRPLQPAQAGPLER